VLDVKQKLFGSLKMSILDFEDIGDTLPLHNHTEDNIHITIVARGSFKFLGDDWEMMVKAGDIIDWKPGKQHQFVALEPNSRCINIPKNVLSSAPVED
jgi:quercetin dioxygenase-like cupin family protein